MKRIILLTFLVVAITAQAQVYRKNTGFVLESIAHIDFGWRKIYEHPAPPKEKKLGNRTYSAKQIGYSQQILEWMQQSYLPKGCLGDGAIIQNPMPKFSATQSMLGNEINKHQHALPHMYGAFSKMYMYLKKDAAGKFVPQADLADYWYIIVNELENITKPVSFISSKDEYYFVLPDFASHPNGYNEENKPLSNLLGFTGHRNFADHRHFYIPSKIIDITPHYVIIMSRDNELPFEKITIGEFFTEAEKQFPLWQKVNPVSAETYTTAQQNLARLKKKYKDKWNDIAELKLINTQISLIDFANAVEGHYDMFDNMDIDGKEGVYTTFPILKVKRSSRELCKTNQPQWLVIQWTGGMVNQPYYIHMHESIMNNFNFDYVYNFFFHPEKVKDQTYKPLRSPLSKETMVISEASEISKRMAADKNVFFFDDFSTTALNTKPNNWYASLANAGTTALVTHQDELEGNWVLLRGNSIKTTGLNQPLPNNFTLSYDLIAGQDFTWGAKGLTMKLSNEASTGNATSFLKLKLRPGYDGKDGEAELETNFPLPQGYSNQTKWYVAHGFSNNKKYNRITVTIKKMDEKLEVFIDKIKIAEYEKAIPPTLRFNELSFDCGGNSAEKDKYFISNIKIMKE